MIDLAEYKATEDETDAVRDVYKLMNDGGTYSHNIIGMILGNISKTNEDLAIAVHEDIQELGY